MCALQVIAVRRTSEMPGMNWPKHVRAGFLTLRGRPARGATEYRRALESVPDDPAALIGVLDDCRARGDATEAVEVATRALARDPSNFIALKGLAWAYLEQEDHHHAKVVVERGIRALDELDTASAFRGMARVVIETTRLALRVWWFRRRRSIPTSSEMEAKAARGLAEWREWAVAYLAWYDQAYGPGPLKSVH